MTQHSENVATIEELYIKEKNKAKIFMISTAVLGVLLVGSLLVIVNDTGADEHQPAASTLMQGQGGGAGGGRVTVTSLFDSDGSLNATAVNDMVAAVPPETQSRFLERFGDRVQYSVTSGEITQAQADALIDYLKLGTVES